MRKFLLAASISVALLSEAAVCSAAPVAEQNRKTGNIEISGLEQTSVTVQVLNPDYVDGEDVTKADIVNFMYFDNHNGTVTVPVYIENDAEYTVRVNGRASDELWQTKVKCYNSDTLLAVTNILSSGTFDEIFDFFEKEVNREVLGVDDKVYTSMTPDGRAKWADVVEKADISQIDDYLMVYDSQFAVIGVSYAKSAEASAKVLDEYSKKIFESELLGYDDYMEFDDDEKADACEIIIKNPQSEKEKFGKIFSEAVFLASIANVDGGADVKPLMEKYKVLLGEDVDEYFSKKNTYSVDSIIAGEAFESIEKLENKICDILDGGSAVNGGNSRPSGGGGGGGSSTHIAAGITPSTATEKAFKDLDGVLWAEEAILALNKKGIISGDGNGSFRPQDSITREEFVKLLTLAFDETVAGLDNPFADVKSDSWYYPYVMSGYSKGLIKGVSDDMFGVGEKITRQDMVVLIYRYLLHKGINFETGDILTFDDKAQISDYALDAVYALNYNGIVKGMEDGTFKPNASSNRAEAAQLIYNALEFSGRYGK